MISGDLPPMSYDDSFLGRRSGVTKTLYGLPLHGDAKYPNRFLNESDTILLIELYPFLEEVGGKKVHETHRVLTGGGIFSMSIFDLCIELDCLDSLSRYMKTSGIPGNILESLSFVNENGYNLVQQGVVAGKLPQVVDFLGKISLGYEGEEEADVYSQTLINLLSHTTEGGFRTNAVLMSAESGSLRYLRDVIYRLLEFDRRAVVDLFCMTPVYYSTSSSLIETIVRNSEFTRTELDILEAVFSEDRDRLRELIENNGRNVYQFSEYALFGDTRANVVETLAIAYKDHLQGSDSIWRKHLSLVGLVRGGVEIDLTRLIPFFDFEEWLHVIKDSPEILDSLNLDQVDSEEEQGTLFQMSRQLQQLYEECTDRAYNLVRLSELSRKTEEAIPSLHDSFRGNELIINLGPTESEAMHAYDPLMFKLREMYGNILKSIFDVEGDVYIGTIDEFDYYNQDPDNTSLRATAPVPLHGGGFRPDYALGDDIIKTAPLSRPGNEARRIITGGGFQRTSKGDNAISEIFPENIFPMLIKPDPNYLPMPIQPEDWLEFISKLTAYRPLVESGSFIDIAGVTAKLTGEFKRIAYIRKVILNEAGLKDIQTFSRELAKFYVEANYAIDRTRIIDTGEVRTRPIKMKILDPKRSGTDLLDFLRYRFAGDPSQKILKNYNGESNDFLLALASGDFSVAMLYENLNAPTITVNEIEEESVDADLGSESGIMDSISYEIKPFAFGYIPITTGYLCPPLDEGELHKIEEVIILGDVELGAYRSPENVGLTLITLAEEIKRSTGLPVMISSAYGKVFERDQVRSGISQLDRNRSIKINVKESLSNTEIPKNEDTLLSDTVSNWFII